MATEKTKTPRAAVRAERDDAVKFREAMHLIRNADPGDAEMARKRMTIPERVPPDAVLGIEAAIKGCGDADRPLLMEALEIASQQPQEDTQA